MWEKCLETCSHAVDIYSPPQRRWPLLGKRQMRMRRISWPMTTCYCASWKHSHSALAYKTLREMIDVFNLRVATELSVTPTNRNTRQAKSAQGISPVLSSEITTGLRMIETNINWYAGSVSDCGAHVCKKYGSLIQFCCYGFHNHHHHRISIMELGHLLTRSDPTYPEVSTKVCHNSFCQLQNSVSLPWVIYYEAFNLHVVSSFSCILVICPKLVLFLIPL